MAQDTSFYINQLDGLYTDPVKSTLWRVFIPNDIWNAAVADGLAVTNFGGFSEEDFKLHVTSAQLPSIGVKTASMSYFGLKKWFATGVEGLDGETSFDVRFLEDMRAYQALLHWNQTVVNAGILKGKPDSRPTLSGQNKSVIAEVPNSANPSVINNNIRVQLYNFREHLPILTVNYVNAMCKKVGEPAKLGYDDPGSTGLTFNFTIQYDRFELDFPKYGEDSQ